MGFPKALMNEHFPAVGPSGQYLVGATNLGFSAVEATIQLNTARTHPQLVASPPNTDTGAFTAGPVVHSLRATPAFVLVQPVTNSVGPFSAVIVTADSSAVYIDARSHTNQQQGVRVRVIAVR